MVLTPLPCADHAKTCDPQKPNPEANARNWFEKFAWPVYASNGADFPFQAGVDDGVTYLLAPFSRLGALREAAMGAGFTAPLRPVLWLDAPYDPKSIPRGKWLLIDQSGSCVMEGGRFASMLPRRGPEEFEARVRLMASLAHRVDVKTIGQ